MSIPLFFMGSPAPPSGSGVSLPLLLSGSGAGSPPPPPGIGVSLPLLLSGSGPAAPPPPPPPAPLTFTATAALSAEAYARSLMQLLPPGVAWNLEPTSNLSKLLTGFADEYARIDGRGAALIDETDPRTTFELLGDWERVLGLPNPCVTTEQSVAQRRAAVLAQLNSLGGSTPAYFIAIAAALGYTVTVTEFSLFDVEDDVDTPIYGDEWAFSWQVNGPLNTIGEVSVDDGVDEPLAWWGNAALECVLVRLKPAHTTVTFSYS